MTKAVFTLCLVFHRMLTVASFGMPFHENRAPLGCYAEGFYIPMGEKMNVEPCRVCSCTESGATCDNLTCPRPNCVDFVLSSDECCWVCPKGLNCKAPWGETIYGTGYAYNEAAGLKCQCEEVQETVEGKPEPLEAKCSPYSTKYQIV